MKNCLLEALVYLYSQGGGGLDTASEGANPHLEKVHDCTLLLDSDVSGLDDDGCCYSQLIESTEVSLWHWRVDETEAHYFVDAQILQLKNLVGHFVTVGARRDFLQAAIA